MKILNVLARSLWARVSAAHARAGGAGKPWWPRSRRPSAPPPAQPAQGRPPREQGGESASAEPFPYDPSFPQLGVATDLELMREVFQRHLKPLDGKAYHVRECRIFGIRRQPALRRFMLQYILRLVDPRTGCERDQWVTGMMYSGWRTRWMLEKLRFQRVWERLRRSGPGRGSAAEASSTFAPAYYVPELEMLVQMFPYDHRLPALPLLMVGPPPELEPLLLSRFGPGDWQAEAWEAEPVRYQAELRATLRLTVRARDTATGRAAEKRFYVKVYHNEKGEQTHEVLRELWSRAESGDAGFTVGRPVAYLSSLRVLVQEEVVGTSLEDMLLRGDDVTPVMRRVAIDLAALHLNQTGTSRRHRLGEEVARLARASRLLRWACPHLGPEIEEIVDAVVAGLREVPPAPTHVDLKPDHIMLDGDRLILIDLDGFARADPILDVARLSAYLTNAPLRSSLHHDYLRVVAQTFVEEYFAHVPEAWRERFPFHYAGACLRLALGLWRRQPPGWPTKVESVVKEAKNSLTGKVWG